MRAAHNHAPSSEANRSRSWWAAFAWPFPAPTPATSLRGPGKSWKARWVFPSGRPWGP